MRTHWIVVAGWAGIFTAAALACGDSVTGDNIPDNPDASTSGTVDGSNNKPDTSFSSTSSSSSSSSGDDDDGSTDAGDIDGGLPTVSVTSLDFQETDCGSTAAPQTFTVDNPSGSPVAFTTELVKATASPFTVSPATATIPAGQSITVTVTPLAVPIPSSTSADGIGDTLKLTIGPTNTTVDLKQTAHGAVIRYSLPSGIDFGNTPIGGSTPINSAFAIANAGNADVPITLSITPDPNLGGDASAFTLTTNPTDAALGLTAAQVTFTPTDTVSYTGGVHLVAGTGPLCDVLPADMPLKGTGTNGVISVTPASVSFGNSGLVDCGTTATQQKVRVTNTSNSPVTYTATLGHSTSFFAVGVATPTPTAATVTGSIPAAPSGSTSFVDIIVQPKAIPTSGVNVAPDNYSDTLDVQTTGTTGNTDNQVVLHQTAHGAILTRSVNSIAFGNVAGGASSSQQYSFSNTGNADITVNLANAFSSIFSQPATVTIGAGTFQTPTVFFRPPVSTSYPNAYNDSATIAQGTPTVPLCGALPASLAFSGSGIAPTTTLSTTSIVFGQIPCGSTNIPGRVVHVTNNGPDVTFDLTFGNVASPPFKASVTKLFIAAGQTQDITITPNNLGTNYANVNALTDTLTLTPETVDGGVADSGIQDTRTAPTISLSVTPQGAIINFASHAPSQALGTAKNPATLSSVVSLGNTGNLPATINFTTTSSASNVFSVSPSQLTLAAGGSGYPSTITFAPPTPLAAATNYTGTWNASVDISGDATSTTLCAPLPLSVVGTPQTGTITLTGTGSIAP